MVKKSGGELNKSVDSSVLLNQSISVEMASASGTKVFPIDKLL